MVISSWSETFGLNRKVQEFNEYQYIPPTFWLHTYISQNLFLKYLVTLYNSDHNYIFCPDMKGFFVEPLSPARPCSSRIYWKTSLKKLLNFRNFSKKVFIWSRFFKGVYKIPNSESFGDLSPAIMCFFARPQPKIFYQV